MVTEERQPGGEGDDKAVASTAQPSVPLAPEQVQALLEEARGLVGKYEESQRRASGQEKRLQKALKINDRITELETTLSAWMEHLNERIGKAVGEEGNHPLPQGIAESRQKREVQTKVDESLWAQAEEEIDKLLAEKRLPREMLLRDGEFVQLAKEGDIEGVKSRAKFLVGVASTPGPSSKTIKETKREELKGSGALKVETSAGPGMGKRWTRGDVEALTPAGRPLADFKKDVMEMLAQMGSKK